MQIIVVGMHRSGTSAVARLLNLMGGYVGTEDALLGANEENPKGFWERNDLRLLDESVLRSVGASWTAPHRFRLSSLTPALERQFEHEAREILLKLEPFRPWVVKDPRLCLVLPLWRPLLEVPVLVHVHRNPAEVAMSLRTRNGMTLPQGLALWEAYSRAAASSLADLPVVNVEYQRLLDDPSETVATLAAELAALGVRRLSLPSVEEIEVFVDPALHRQRCDESRSRRLMTPAQWGLWQAIREGADRLPSPSPDLEAALDSIPTGEVLAAAGEASEGPLTRLEREREWVSTLLAEERAARAEVEQRLRRAEERARVAEEIRRLVAAERVLERNRLDAERLLDTCHELEEALERLVTSARWRLRRLVDSGSRWLEGDAGGGHQEPLERARRILARIHAWQARPAEWRLEPDVLLEEVETTLEVDSTPGIERRGVEARARVTASFEDLERVLRWATALGRELDELPAPTRWRSHDRAAAARSALRLAPLRLRVERVRWGVEARRDGYVAAMSCRTQPSTG